MPHGPEIYFRMTAHFMSLCHWQILDSLKGLWLDESAPAASDEDGGRG